jgi:hypothetical protein
LNLGLVGFVIVYGPIVAVVAKLAESRVLEVVLLLQLFIQNWLLCLFEHVLADWQVLLLAPLRTTNGLD